MASALDAAHEKGSFIAISSPGNVMVTQDGVVKVLDFGLVGTSNASDPGLSPEDSPTLTLAATQAGFIMGTAAYMATQPPLRIFSKQLASSGRTRGRQAVPDYSDLRRRQECAIYGGV